jgi:hypothetical protein
MGLLVKGLRASGPYRLEPQYILFYSILCHSILFYPNDRTLTAYENLQYVILTFLTPEPYSVQDLVPSKEHCSRERKGVEASWKIIYHSKNLSLHDNGIKV